MSGQKNKMQKSFGPQKFDYKKFYPKSFVKIRSVTADIFLIWTNVTKKFWSKILFYSKNLGETKCWAKKLRLSKNWAKKVWSELGQ